MKLQKTTTRVLCGAMALVLATVSAAAATADSLPPMSEYYALSNPAQQPNILAQTNTTNEQDESQEQEETNYLGKKSETVYVNLHSDGSVRETIVTDWLHSDVEGTQLPDRTDLDDLTNVKGTETPEKSGDSLVWNLSGKDLYYRGKTDKPLPLEVSITYSLDGKEMPAEELAGKSGKMEMNLRFRNNTSNTVTIAGKHTEMQTPLMVIAGMSLSSDHFSNVEVSDGNVTADGNNQMISIMSMPGLEKSLNIGNYSLSEINDMDFPEEFTVTADVSEFEMGPIGIAVTSELPNLDDIKKSDDIDDMRQDLYDLQDMQDDLNRADPDRDLRSLITNPERTGASQLLVDDIFTFYDLNKDILDILPKYITEENIKLYDRVKYDLKDSTLDTMLDDEVVSDLLDLVDEISPAKLQSLADNFEKLDLEALRTLMDRCNELSAVFGDSDTQKHVATLKKLAACRKPLGNLMNDMNSLGSMNMDTLDNSVFIPLLRAIEMQIPTSSGKSIMPLLEETFDQEKLDQAQTPTDKKLQEETESQVNTDPSDTVDGQETNESTDNQKPSDSVDGQETNEGTDKQKPSDSVDGQETNESTEKPSSGDVTEGKEKTDSDSVNDTDHSDTNPSELDDKSDSQSSSDDIDENNIEHVSVLAAYVENAEHQNAIVKDTEIESQNDVPEDAEAKSQVDVSKEVKHEPQIDTAPKDVVFALNASSDQDFDEARESVLKKLNNSPIPDEKKDEIKKNIQGIVGLRSQFKTILGHANDLNEAMTNAGLTAEDDLPGAMAFADSMVTKMGSLQPLIEACFAPLVKNESDPAKRAIIIQTAMKELTEDLAANKENFTSMILLMNKLKEEDLLDDIEYIDDLRKDMQDLRPIVKDLNRDLDKNYINISLHQSPESTNTLLKMKDDLEIHRDISESLRTAMLPKNIDIGRSMIETLDRLEAKDAVDDSLDKVDDADELLDRKEALVTLSDEYQIFTDAPDELETELKFIMKTDEIEAPEEDKEIAEPEEQKGFFAWCKDLFHQVTGKE